jgi:hypothetical protein
MLSHVYGEAACSTLSTTHATVIQGPKATTTYHSAGIRVQEEMRLHLLFGGARVTYLDGVHQPLDHFILIRCCWL